jgi:hypothetical protein
MTSSNRKTNPKKLFDPRQENLGGNIGIVGLLVAAMGERVGRNFILPVYERIVKSLKRVHPRVWAISGIMVSILVLLLVVYATISVIVGDEPVAEAETITVAQALSAPFNLNDRAVVDSQATLSAVVVPSFGDFTRVLELDESASYGRLTSCLVNDGGFTCDLEYTPQYSNASFYTDSKGNTIEVVVANYWNDLLTSETMVDAVNQARAFSRVGNFVVGAGELDYFYNTTRLWFSFTWGHGSWVYSISASNPDVLQAAVQAFPY